MNKLTYDIIKNGLDASSMRQKAISSNIANVNTPGYKASKIVFESELRKALGKGDTDINATNTLHMGGHEDIPTGKIMKTSGSSVDETGNSVNMDKEMIDLAANEIYYSALIQEINRKLGTMSYIINR